MFLCVVEPAPRHAQGMSFQDVDADFMGDTPFDDIGVVPSFCSVFCAAHAMPPEAPRRGLTGKLDGVTLHIFILLGESLLRGLPLFVAESNEGSMVPHRHIVANLRIAENTGATTAVVLSPRLSSVAESAALSILNFSFAAVVPTASITSVAPDDAFLVVAIDVVVVAIANPMIGRAVENPSLDEPVVGSSNVTSCVASHFSRQRPEGR